MRCAWQVEIDDYASKVLAKHWPNVARFRDVRECGAHNLTAVDLIAGGFPCQDISIAGAGTGLDGERSGLWFEFARLIDELRPRYILVENVAALLGRGFDRVLGSLAALGYDAEWECLPASAFGAPHQRERVFIIAYSHQERCGRGGVFDRCDDIPTYEQWGTAKGIRQWAGWQRWISKTVQDGLWSEPNAPILGVADGVSARVERIGGLGNAVVPQVAEWIGRRILEHSA